MKKRSGRRFSYKNNNDTGEKIKNIIGISKWNDENTHTTPKKKKKNGDNNNINVRDGWLEKFNKIFN